MPTNEFMVITILSCGLVTWLSRILPFVLLKRLEIGQKVQDFLSFVPIAILSKNLILTVVIGVISLAVVQVII